MVFGPLRQYFWPFLKCFSIQGKSGKGRDFSDGLVKSGKNEMPKHTYNRPVYHYVFSIVITIFRLKFQISTIDTATVGVYLIQHQKLLESPYDVHIDFKNLTSAYCLPYSDSDT